MIHIPPNSILALTLAVFLTSVAFAGCLDTVKTAEEDPATKTAEGDSALDRYRVFKERLAFVDNESLRLYENLLALFNGTRSASQIEADASEAVNAIDPLRADLALSTPLSLKNFSLTYDYYLLHLKMAYEKKQAAPSAALSSCCAESLQHANEAFTAAKAELAVLSANVENAKVVEAGGSILLPDRPSLPAQAVINTQLAAVGGSGKIVLKHLSGDRLEPGEWKYSIQPDGDDAVYCVIGVSFEEGRQMTISNQSSGSTAPGVPACDGPDGRPNGDGLSSGTSYRVMVVNVTANTVLLDRTLVA